MLQVAQVLQHGEDTRLGTTAKLLPKGLVALIATQRWQKASAGTEGLT